jgi:hypothetical protein
MSTNINIQNSYIQPPPERRGTHQVHRQKRQSSVKALRHLGIHKNPAPLTEDAGTFSRPGNHLADIANLLHRRKICSSEEVQRLHEYGCQDQMRINFLQRQLAAERQLGHTEGLAQATQIQLHSPPTDREYGQGRPLGRDYDDNYACDGRLSSNLL